MITPITSELAKVQLPIQNRLIPPHGSIGDGIDVMEVRLPGIILGLVLLVYDTDAIEAGARVAVFLELIDQQTGRLWNHKVSDPQHVGIDITQAVVIKQREHLVHHLACIRATTDEGKMRSARLALRLLCIRLIRRLRYLHTQLAHAVEPAFLHQVDGMDIDR